MYRGGSDLYGLDADNEGYGYEWNNATLREEEG
jgi:hypothetical protein